jgi:hypothetical protein
MLWLFDLGLKIIIVIGCTFGAYFTRNEPFWGTSGTLMLQIADASWRAAKTPFAALGCFLSARSEQQRLEQSAGNPQVSAPAEPSVPEPGFAQWLLQAAIRHYIALATWWLEVVARALWEECGQVAKLGGLCLLVLAIIGGLLEALLSVGLGRRLLRLPWWMTPFTWVAHLAWATLALTLKTLVAPWNWRGLRDVAATWGRVFGGRSDQPDEERTRVVDDTLARFVDSLRRGAALLREKFGERRAAHASADAVERLRALAESQGGKRKRDWDDVVLDAHHPGTQIRCLPDDVHLAVPRDAIDHLHWIADAPWLARVFYGISVRVFLVKRNDDRTVLESHPQLLTAAEFAMIAFARGEDCYLGEPSERGKEAPTRWQCLDLKAERFEPRPKPRSKKLGRERWLSRVERAAAGTADSSDEEEDAPRKGAQRQIPDSDDDDEAPPRRSARKASSRPQRQESRAATPHTDDRVAAMFGQVLAAIHKRDESAAPVTRVARSAMTTPVRAPDDAPIAAEVQLPNGSAVATSLIATPTPNTPSPSPRSSSKERPAAATTPVPQRVGQGHTPAAAAPDGIPAAGVAAVVEPAAPVAHTPAADPAAASCKPAVPAAPPEVEPTGGAGAGASAGIVFVEDSQMPRHRVNECWLAAATLALSRLMQALRPSRGVSKTVRLLRDPARTHRDGVDCVARLLGLQRGIPGDAAPTLRALLNAITVDNVRLADIATLVEQKEQPPRNHKGIARLVFDQHEDQPAHWWCSVRVGKRWVSVDQKMADDATKHANALTLHLDVNAACFDARADAAFGVVAASAPDARPRVGGMAKLETDRCNCGKTKAEHKSPHSVQCGFCAQRFIGECSGLPRASVSLYGFLNPFRCQGCTAAAATKRFTGARRPRQPAEVLEIPLPASRGIQAKRAAAAARKELVPGQVRILRRE